MNTFIRFAARSLTVAALGACDAAPSNESAPPGKTINIPEWVLRGTNVDGSTLYAVGAKSGIKNEPRRDTAAANQARAEMARTIETLTALLIKNYRTGAASGPSSEEQMIEMVLKTSAASALSDLKIVAGWTDPRSGARYAMARFDLDRWVDPISESKDLSSSVGPRIRSSMKQAIAEVFGK